MRLSVLCTFGLAAILMLGTTPAFAAEKPEDNKEATSEASAAPTALPGVWTTESLAGYGDKLWGKRSVEEIGEAVDSMPDRIGSRALNQLAKSLLLAPTALKDDTDRATLDAVTAKRLAKLLSMGGLKEAKQLEGARSTDDTPPGTALMEQSLMTLLAANEREAACLDLLAYKSENKENFEALSTPFQSLSSLCLATMGGQVPADIPNMPLLSRAGKLPVVVSLSQFDALDDMQATLVAYHPNVTIAAGSGESAADIFPKMAPFKQALVINSGRTAAPVLWRLLPYALRHDLVDSARAKEIFDMAPLSGKLIPVTEARTQAKDKNGFERLPLYYKTLASYGKGETPPIKELATDILAAGLTSNLYDLLPFAGYIDNVDLSTQTPRSAFAAALVLGINGQSTMGSKGSVQPKESHWILSVLLQDTAYNLADFSTWHDTNMKVLAGLSPQLKDKIYLMLQRNIAKEADKNPILSDYVNRKELTQPDNYVMHEELQLSKAESSAEDGDIGGMIIAIVQANGNNAPDRLNPAEIVDVVGLLNDTALTRTARRLAMESLVFTIKAPAAANGEQ